MRKVKSRSLNIMGKTYRLIYKPLRDADGIYTYGISHHAKEKIEINARSSKCQQKATLLHEIIHCISGETGLRLKESQISTIASALYDTLKRNGLKL